MDPLVMKITESCSEKRAVTLYGITCEQIGRFYLRAGCPSVTHEPHEDITNLRFHVLSTRSHSRESDLQAESRKAERPVLNTATLYHKPNIQAYIRSAARSEID